MSRKQPQTKPKKSPEVERPPSADQYSSDPDLERIKSIRLDSVDEDLEYPKKFDPIPDRYESLDDVRDAINDAGITTCGLIFAIDYTMSNKLQGQKSFNGKSLHDLKSGMNPYQQVICILGETLGPMIHDGKIPTFGFGDERTKDRSIFPLKETYCEGFSDVLDVYMEVTPTVKMSGPTNFAPIIEEAVTILKKQKSYYILVIVADGQVTSEKATIQAIVEASKYPLSIVVIGVGDGPWDVMEDFDDKLPEREFDNFQFVNFHEVMSSARNPQAALAMNALMEIPDQYHEIRKKGYLRFR